MAVHKIEVDFKNGSINGTMVISNRGFTRWDANQLAEIDFEIKDDTGKEIQFSVGGSECEELAKYFVSLLKKFTVPKDSDKN